MMYLQHKSEYINNGILMTRPIMRCTNIQLLVEQNKFIATIRLFPTLDDAVGLINQQPQVLVVNLSNAEYVLTDDGNQGGLVKPGVEHIGELMTDKMDVISLGPVLSSALLAMRDHNNDVIVENWELKTTVE